MKLYQIWLVFLVLSSVINCIGIYFPEYAWEFGLLSGIFISDYDNYFNMIKKTKEYFVSKFKR